MASQPHAIARSLPAIVIDLATTRQRLACHYAGHGESVEMDRLERRRFALEAEFEISFYEATGVNWTLAKESMS
jgi:hypothetical protein